MSYETLLKFKEFYEKKGNQKQLNKVLANLALYKVAEKEEPKEEVKEEPKEKPKKQKA